MPVSYGRNTRKSCGQAYSPLFLRGLLPARGVTEGHLNNWGAKFASPAIFVALVEWADRIIAE